MSRIDQALSATPSMPTNPPTPTIELTSAAERDVDLLLVRDLADGDWLLAPVLQVLAATVSGIDPALEVTRIARSVMTSDGESDLELDLASPAGRRVRILVENKIDAILQPRQAERYAARAGRFADGDTAITMLVAPAAYSGGGAAGFDARIDHEWLLARYRTRAATHPGAAFGVALLEAALDRSRHGYVKEEDRVMTTFWRAYWETATDAAPALRMPEPDVAGARNTWIAFRPVTRPTHVRLLHKLDRGLVHLQFGPAAMSAAAARDRLAALAGHPLAEGVAVVTTGEATSWERRVPVVDPQHSFSSQHAAAVAGMQAALDLMSLLDTSLAEDRS